MPALVLVGACGLAFIPALPPWVLLLVVGSAALLYVVGAFRREQRKLDRILREALDPVEDGIGSAVATVDETSTGSNLAPVSVHRSPETGISTLRGLDAEVERIEGPGELVKDGS